VAYGGCLPPVHVREVGSSRTAIQDDLVTTSPRQVSARGSTTKSRLTRERILDATAAILRERGLAELRLTDVADRAGLHAPSIYYHFKSREDLIEEVLDLGIKQTLEVTQRRVAALPPEAHILRIHEAIVSHVEMVIATGNYSTLNLRESTQLPERHRKRLHRRQRIARAYWLELLRHAQAAGALSEDLDLEVMSMLIFGAMNWSAQWYQPGRLTPTEIGRYASRLVLDGMRHEPSL
jgi:TetR/AcrR family transcriptional regulator, cholesterol catabolism regulator